MKPISKQGKPAPILVTAATGKTGRHVVKQLLERGFPVRALAHCRDDRTERLTLLGADVVIGDFFNIDSLRSAMEGVKRAYFCFPPADRLLEATVNFAVASKQAGLEAVVNMSQMHAREAHPSSLTRQHWLGERVLDWAGIGATHLRCTFFAETYLMMNGVTIASEGKFYLPHDDGKHAPVTCEDVARVVVGVLSKPRPHIGKIYTVTGPDLLSQREVAAAFSTVLGKPVEYVAVSLDTWQRAAAGSGIPHFLIDHLSYAAEDYKSGHFARATDVVRKVGGKRPQAFEDFITSNAQAFSRLEGG